MFVFFLLRSIVTSVSNLNPAYSENKTDSLCNNEERKDEDFYYNKFHKFGEITEKIFETLSKLSTEYNKVSIEIILFLEFNDMKEIPLESLRTAFSFLNVVLVEFSAPFSNYVEQIVVKYRNLNTNNSSGDYKNKIIQLKEQLKEFYSFKLSIFDKICGSEKKLSNFEINEYIKNIPPHLQDQIRTLFLSNKMKVGNSINLARVYLNDLSSLVEEVAHIKD